MQFHLFAGSMSAVLRGRCQVWKAGGLTLHTTGACRDLAGGREVLLDQVLMFLRLGRMSHSANCTPGAGEYVCLAPAEPIFGACGTSVTLLDGSSAATYPAIVL